MLGRLMVGSIRLYQLCVSGLRPSPCRFVPTCSEYTRIAVESHGPGRGVWLGLKRIARCRPWGGHGFDPVPEVDGGER